MSLKNIITLLLIPLTLWSCKEVDQSLMSSASGLGGQFLQHQVEVDQFNSVTIELANYISAQDAQDFDLQSYTQGQIGEVKVVNHIRKSISYTHQIYDSSNLDSFSVSFVDYATRSKTFKLYFSVKIIGNQLAIAVDDVATTKEDTAVLIDVLANDQAPNGGSLTIDSISVAPQHGTAKIENGKVRYTPDNGFKGDDEFDYIVRTDQGVKDSAKVSISVTEKNNGGGGGDIKELPMRIIFVMTVGSTKALNYQQDAQFALDIMNGAQVADGQAVNKYYLDEVLRIEDNTDGIMSTSEFNNSFTSKYGKDGTLTTVFVEDIPGGVLGIAHGIDCVIPTNGSSCKMLGLSKSVVVNEYAGLRTSGGNCATTPLGCTVTHELGHHLGYRHLSGEATGYYNYNRCGLTDVKYYHTSQNISYTHTYTDNNGVLWNIGPHAMRKGGGTTQRNGGFFLEGYKENAIQMHECYNQISADNLGL